MTAHILVGDALTLLRRLPDEMVHCVVTSPPYWGLRDYGTATWEGGDPACEHRSPTMREGRNEERAKLAGSAVTNMAQLLLVAKAGVCGRCGAVRSDQQLGLEPTYHEHIAAMVSVFREVRRVLRKDGTLWLNYGDSYATSPNGRSAAAVKAIGSDDRTFRDKPFSTIGGALKAKDLAGMPWRVALALQDDGWYLRQDIIWAKPNPMPESVRDRCTKSHEYIFLMAKSERYHFDSEAMREPCQTNPKENYPARARVTGRGEQGASAARGGDRDKSGGFPPRKSGNKERKQRPGADILGIGAQAGSIPWTDTDGMRNRRSVWTVTTRPFKEAHFATFPPDLIEPCILAGCPAGGTVLDPFGGAGTTGLVAEKHGRHSILLELNPAYAEIARVRIGANTTVRHLQKTA